jgi:antirestriction protein
MMEDMRIYVASLSDYNDGRLEGKWFDLSDYPDASDLMMAIQEMLDELTEKYNDGEVREEWAVHDYEGIPSTLASEYMGEQDFQQLYDIAIVADEFNIPVAVLIERAGDTGSDDYKALAYSLIMVVDGNDESDIVSEYEDQVGELGYDWWSNYVGITKTDQRLLYGEDVDNFKEEILAENPDMDESEAEGQAEERADEEQEQRNSDLIGYLQERGYENEFPNWVYKDYEDAWKYGLSYEFDVIYHDGEMYVFSNNYSVGGTILSGMIGAYIGYKIGRAKPQKKGFETEKKIGRKIKGAYSKKKYANGVSVAEGGDFLESKGYKYPRQVFFELDEESYEVTQAQKDNKQVAIYYYTYEFEEPINQKWLDKFSKDFGDDFSITLYTNAGVDLHSSSKGQYKNIKVERLKGNYAEGGGVSKFPVAIERRINEINELLPKVKEADEIAGGYFGSTHYTYVQLEKPIEIKGKYVYIHSANGKYDMTFEKRYNVNKLGDEIDGRKSLNYDLSNILKAFKSVLKDNYAKGGAVKDKIKVRGFAPITKEEAMLLNEDFEENFNSNIERFTKHLNKVHNSKLRVIDTQSVIDFANQKPTTEELNNMTAFNLMEAMKYDKKNYESYKKALLKLYPDAKGFAEGGEVEDFSEFDFQVGDKLDLGSKGIKYFKQYDGEKIIVVDSKSDLKTSKGSSTYPSSVKKVLNRKYAEGGGVDEKITKSRLKAKLYEPTGDFFIEDKGDKWFIHFTPKDASKNSSNLSDLNAKSIGNGYYGSAYSVDKVITHKYDEGGNVKEGNKYEVTLRNDKHYGEVGVSLHGWSLDNRGTYYLTLQFPNGSTSTYGQGEVKNYGKRYSNGGGVDNPSRQQMLDYLNMYFDYYSELRTIAVEEDNILTRRMLKSLDDEELEMAYEDAQYEIKSDTQYADGGEVDGKKLPQNIQKFKDNFAEGGLNTRMRTWYMKTFPQDERGQYIDLYNTFADLWNALQNKQNVYDVIGEYDSLIRERLFDKLSQIKGVKYMDVYNLWLEIDDDEYAQGGGISGLDDLIRG